MSRRVGADLSFSVRLEGDRALNFVSSSSEGAIKSYRSVFSALTSSKTKTMFGSDSHRPMGAASSSVSSSFSSSSSSSTGSIRDLRSASPNTLPASSDALSLTFVDDIFEKVLTTFLGGSDGGEDGSGGSGSGTGAGLTPVGMGRGPTSTTRPITC